MSLMLQGDFAHQTPRTSVLLGIVRVVPGRNASLVWNPKFNTRATAGTLDEGPLDALLMALATLYGTFAGGNVGEHLSKGRGDTSAPALSASLHPTPISTETSR